jgi:hypothetical protein
MASEKKDKTIAAVEAVHTALKKLNSEERQRVLASVRALLNMSFSPSDKLAEDSEGEASGPVQSGPTSTVASARPLAVRELIQDKKPRTHPQFIALFAYYREKHENRPSFSRDDLRRYYTTSRENPPKNFDRDFVEAVKRGWIHEDAENSYITSKGIEAVASGFVGGDEKPARKVHTGKRKKQLPKKRH